MDSCKNVNLEGKSDDSEANSSVVDLSKSYEAQISINLIDNQANTRYDSWKYSLIGRLDLLRIKFVDASNMLLKQWKISGKCQLIPLGKRFFTIKLENEVDKNYIKYGLSLEYWDEEILFKLSRALGNHVKVDDATLNYQSGYYARVLVEIDLAKTIPNKLCIITKYGCFSQSVVLTNLPKFCWKCKIVGHQYSECRAKNQSETSGEKVNSSSLEKQKEVNGSTSEKLKDILQSAQQVIKPFDICQTPEKVQVENIVGNSVNTISISQGRFSPLQDDTGI
ncbi:uncharacterized protein LOC113291562 [Papaver somniferum]|uniref:uncharacterized protein LOC113291562 n=1 Tax=Papaver somniferum TaxID=3469 RepID=UPI000E704764|nr:uncharacterized protein LOC113291562 [Papaver somniferum]